MVDYSTLSIIFTGLSISIAAFYYISTLRNTKKNQELQLETRQTQLFMHFNDKFESRRDVWNEIKDEWSWNDYDDFMRKYGPESNAEEWMKFLSIAGLFEQIGVLAKHGSVDVKLIYDLMAG